MALMPSYWEKTSSPVGLRFFTAIDQSRSLFLTSLLGQTCRLRQADQKLKA
jgi:hypothetical protein